jgi:hypothetical protein
LNPFSYEIELLAIIVFLYLYDSSVLLYANEAILATSGGARWTASWGWPGFVVAGKSPCMLNPLTPYRASFRLSWQFDGAGERGGDPSWTKTADLIRRLGPTTVVCAVGLFLLLPLGLFTPLSTYALIGAAVLIYGSTITGLVRLGGIRHELGLKGLRFASFAFECLACPPFSANMLRRIALSQKVAEPLTLAGCRLLDATTWTRLRGYCESRLEEEMQALAQDSAARAALELRKRELANRSSAR